MSTTVNQHQFSQSKPFHYCRNSRHTLDLCRELVADGKINYIFRCRNPRCSYECHKAWSRKHSCVLNRLLDKHVKEPKYRGCLKLRKDATPQEHVRAKRLFLRTMKRWAERTGHTFAIHATMDITSPTNCHWDCVAYSDAPVTPLKRAVSTAWSRAGGVHQSLMPLDDDEIEAQCRYAAKDLASERRKGRRPYLPVNRPKGEPSGLNCQWYSAGFWQGHKVADLWREVIDQWIADGVFGEPASNREETTLRPREDPETTPRTGDPGADSGAENEGGDGRKVVSSLLETDPPKPSLADRIRAANPRLDRRADPIMSRVEQAALLAEIDDRIAKLKYRNATNIHGMLPTSPDTAITVDEIGASMDMPAMVVGHWLKHCHMVKRVIARGEPTRYYRDEPYVPERQRIGSARLDASDDGRGVA